MRFFTGLDDVHHAVYFDAAFISVNRLLKRKKPLACNDVILDSGAFSLIAKYGKYPDLPQEYAKRIVAIKRLIEAGGGRLLAAVSQDYMCEQHMLEKTGLTVPDHQRLTIERYDALLQCETKCYILPVLQGYKPEDYVKHVQMYGSRLTQGMWVGVGSVCKRNGNIGAIEEVLLGIHRERPDLRLHGFGLKTTALSSGLIQELLESADSMAWSYAARREGRDNHDWREAKRWAAKITDRFVQLPLYIPD